MTDLMQVINMLLKLAVFALVSHVVTGDLGTASTYHPPYLPTQCYGYRMDQFPPGYMFAAVAEGLWDNGAACGRIYRLRCLSTGNNNHCKDGVIDVKVVNFCRSCPSSILLPVYAFAAIAQSQATISIEYVQI